MVGLLGVAEFVPLLLVAFLGGAMADHFNRRHVILGCDSLLTVVLGVLTVNALAPHPHVPLLFAAAGILAALNSMQRPAIEAMTPQLVRPEEMTAVSSLNSIRGNAAFIAGPGIAGWIAVTFGPACAFGVDAATYLCGMGALLAMRQKQFKGGDEGGLSWHALVEGWRYALQRRDLLGTYLIDMNAMFFGMPNALFPAFGSVFGNQNVGLALLGGATRSVVAQPHFRLDQPLPTPWNGYHVCRRFVGCSDHRLPKASRPVRKGRGAA